MELIQQNIKLYCRFNDGKEFALSENNKVGYIINASISYVDHNEKIELKRNLSNRKSNK
jgi:hypothetical protein